MLLIDKAKVRAGAKNSIYYRLIPASVYLMSQIRNCLGFPSGFLSRAASFSADIPAYFQENPFYRPHQPNQHLLPARGVRTLRAHVESLPRVG